MSRVAVRIVRRGELFYVIGRRTVVICSTFDAAWTASLAYFACRAY